MNGRLAHRARSLGVALATALVIVSVAIVPFLTPAWIAFEQGRAQATAWTGYTDAQLREATDAIVADLVLGPPALGAVRFCNRHDCFVAMPPAVEGRGRHDVRSKR